MSHFQFVRRALQRAAIVVMAASLAALLTACATAQLSLTGSEVRELRISDVRVKYAPQFVMVWEAAEEEFAARQPISKRPKIQRISTGDGNAALEETLAKAAARAEIARSPEGRAYMRDKLTTLIKERAAEVLQTKFKGARPVILEVELVGFQIPSAGQKVMIGGSNIMGAITRIIDAGSGKELGKMDRGAAAATGGGLLGSAIEATMAAPAEQRLVANYIGQVDAWLTARQ